MINGIVFDMDGLMFDTENLAIQAWVYAGGRTGRSVTPELVRQTIGLDAARTKEVFMRRLGADLDFAALRQLKLDFMEDSIRRNGVPVKPGLLDLLRYLKDMRLRTAVATSTEAARALFYLEQAGIAGFLDGVVCGDAVEKGKPAPDIYRKACEKIGLAPAECLALEDSPIGILSAYRAGMRPVFIPDLLEASDDIVSIPFVRLRSLSDVIPLLEKHADGASV
jgi:HAD superfamily hydrolase (TIGR01509 family)